MAEDGGEVIVRVADASDAKVVMVSTASSNTGLSVVKDSVFLPSLLGDGEIK